MSTIMPINEAIELASSPTMTWMDRKDLLAALQDYSGIMSAALEVVGPHCTEIIAAMEEGDMRDDEDQTLTQAELDSWVGLEAALGGQPDIPAWYQDMWIDNPPTGRIDHGHSTTIWIRPS